MTNVQDGEKDPRTNEEQSINRGVELMLRRDKKEPEKAGFRFFQTLTLLKRKLYIGVEFTWRRVEDT